MKRIIKQKSLILISLITLISVLCAALPLQVAASMENIAIALTGNELTLGALGKLYCYGETQADPIYYDCGVVVELQQYIDDDWETIKTWSDYGNAWALVEKNYYVEKGYAYQLKVTHSAYDIDTGEEVESFVKYSVCVRYD